MANSQTQTQAEHPWSTATGKTTAFATGPTILETWTDWIGHSAWYDLNVSKSSCWQSTKTAPKSSKRDWSRQNKLTSKNAWTICPHRRQRRAFSEVCVATLGPPMSKCASRRPSHWSMTLTAYCARHLKQPSTLGSASSKIWKVDNASHMKFCEKGGGTTSHNNVKMRFSLPALPCRLLLILSWPWDPHPVAKPKVQTIFQGNFFTTSLWNWQPRFTLHSGSYFYMDRRTFPTRVASLYKHTRGVAPNIYVNLFVHYWFQARSAKPFIERLEHIRRTSLRSSCRSIRSAANAWCPWPMDYIKSELTFDTPSVTEIVLLSYLSIWRKHFIESSDLSAWAAPSVTRP